jgi:serine/threonine protein kinase
MVRQEITGLHKLELFVEPWNGGPERIRLESPIRLGKETDLWGARDPSGHPWAVRLLSHFVSDPGEWEQMEILSRVRHPQVVWVMGKVEAQGRSGLVREWVRGTPIDQIWQPNEEIPVIEEVFRNILVAVREVHRAGVVHGGLKPARVFLDREKRTVKVVDFGIGPWLPPRPEDGPWLAPEQRQNYTRDERGDIYSLGAILYWLSCGVVPDVKPRPLHQLRPELPTGLLRAVDEAMRLDRDARLGSCSLLLDLIGEGFTNRPIYKVSESFPMGLEDAQEEDGSPDQTFDDACNWQDGEDGQEEPSLKNTRRPDEEPTGARNEPQQKSQSKNRVELQKEPRSGAPPVSAPAGTQNKKPERPVNTRALATESLPETEAPKRPPKPDPAPTSLSRYQLNYLIAAILLGTFLGGGIVLVWWIMLPRLLPQDSQPVVEVEPPTATIPTFFEFAGSTQPGSVVINCPGGYQQQVVVSGGRAMVDSVPSINGCLMYPKGVTVDRPVPVKQGIGYACVVDRGVLTCRVLSASGGRGRR